MVAIAPAIMSAFEAENDKKKQRAMQEISAFLSGKHKIFWNYSAEFSCDSLARRGSQVHPSCKEVGKNEGQDCWDWLITWGPHMTLPQIKVELC